MKSCRLVLILILILILGLGLGARATLVQFPLSQMFAVTNYAKPITITAQQPEITDGTNIYVGTYEIVIPAGGTNPVVPLTPNNYLLTFQDAHTALRFTVPATNVTMNLLNLITNGLSTFPSWTGGSNGGTNSGSSIGYIAKVAGAQNTNVLAVSGFGTGSANGTYTNMAPAQSGWTNMLLNGFAITPSYGPAWSITSNGISYYSQQGGDGSGIPLSSEASYFNQFSIGANPAFGPVVWGNYYTTVTNFTTGQTVLQGGTNVTVAGSGNAIVFDVPPNTFDAAGAAGAVAAYAIAPTTQPLSLANGVITIDNLGYTTLNGYAVVFANPPTASGLNLNNVPITSLVTNGMSVAPTNGQVASYTAAGKVVAGTLGTVAGLSSNTVIAMAGSTIAGSNYLARMDSHSFTNTGTFYSGNPGVQQGAIFVADNTSATWDTIYGGSNGLAITGNVSVSGGAFIGGGLLTNNNGALATLATGGSLVSSNQAALIAALSVAGGTANTVQTNAAGIVPIPLVATNITSAAGGQFTGLGSGLTNAAGQSFLGALTAGMTNLFQLGSMATNSFDATNTAFNYAKTATNSFQPTNATLSLWALLTPTAITNSFDATNTAFNFAKTATNSFQPTNATLTGLAGVVNTNQFAFTNTPIFFSQLTTNGSGVAPAAQQVLTYSSTGQFSWSNAPTGGGSANFSAVLSGTNVLVNSAGGLTNSFFWQMTNNSWIDFTNFSVSAGAQLARAILVIYCTNNPPWTLTCSSNVVFGVDVTGWTVQSNLTYLSVIGPFPGVANGSNVVHAVSQVRGYPY